MFKNALGTILASTFILGCCGNPVEVEPETQEQVIIIELQCEPLEPEVIDPNEKSILVRESVEHY